MTHKPTPEQEAIINAGTNTTTNLIIEARAGAAKTTTLEMLANVLPESKPILYLAFNKKIADEAQQRLPSHCTARTLNALGHRAWSSQINKRLFVDKKKMFDLVIFHINDDFSLDEQRILNENFADLLRLTGFAKQCGYVPDSVAEKKKTVRPLCSDDEFFGERCYLELEPEERRLIRLVIQSSIEAALVGKIDYDDQIYMPTIFPCSFEYYPVVMVDEAQDLSLINHAMLRKIAKRSRLIAVGDPCQPLGTLITRVKQKADRWNEAKLEQVPIEDICEGDLLLGHNANGSFMYNRKVLGITRKPFEGNLVCAGPTRYTPNHHCYTRFASLANHWCIYLMRKNSAYRIGKARMSYGEQGLGPQIRAKAEGADAMWILSTYKTEEEAFIAEAVIQTEFGLSDLCFIDLTRPWLTAFWNEMATLNLETRARACLTAYHREFDYPLWTIGDSIPAKRPFITRACNLLDGGELLSYTGNRKTGKNDWTAYPIIHEPYSDDVISFTISDNHLYVADNIVTHNCQAIYGFRGAHQDSMNVLAEQFSMQRMYLTTSFRCPASVIQLAQQRAPDMQAPEWAKEGQVTYTPSWQPIDIPDSAVVICRNNAPLFHLAIQMIKAGKSPEFLGRDVVKALYNKMKKLGKHEIRRAQLLVEINNWYEREQRRNRDSTTPGDYRDAMLVFAEQTETLGEALQLVQSLAERRGRIKLMTGHKAKGLEFDNVFFLNQDLCNRERGQDWNVWYVIVTRSMNQLTFIDSDFMETETYEVDIDN